MVAAEAVGGEVGGGGAGAFFFWPLPPPPGVVEVLLLLKVVSLGFSTSCGSALSRNDRLCATAPYQTHNRL